MTAHLKVPMPSPAIMEKLGSRFRREVKDFADAHQVPVVKFTNRLDASLKRLARESLD